MSIRGSSARSNTLSWLVEVNMVRMSFVRFMKFGQNAGKMLNRAFRTVLQIGIPGLPARQRRLPDRTHHDDRGRNHWTPISTLWGCLQSGERLSNTTSRVICFWYGFAASPVTRNPVRCSGIQNQPVQFRAIRNTPVWRTAPRGIPAFQDDGSGASRGHVRCCIHQRTDGFDKIHTKPGRSAVEGVVIFHTADEAGSAVSGSRTAHAAHAKDADNFALIRRPEGACAIVEIRNSIHKICSVMRNPQCVLPVNELTCYGLRMRLME